MFSEDTTNENIILNDNTQIKEKYDLEIIQQEDTLENNDNILYPTFDVNHIFQNPSYLIDKDIYKYEYECDNSFSQCRVNYNLSIDE